MDLKRGVKTFINILFYIYMAVLLLFVCMKFTGDFPALVQESARVRALRDEGTLNANFELFRTINIYWKLIHSTNGVYLRNLVGNIIPFIPLGIFELLRHRRKKRFASFLTAMFHCLFIILCIELVQLITGLGYFDVDDILLNMIGCVIGAACYRICRIFLSPRILSILEG